ncbi:hypothetical protein J3A83DRAFT_4189127 [Scleroderma citrinum]
MAFSESELDSNCNNGHPSKKARACTPNPEAKMDDVFDSLKFIANNSKSFDKESIVKDTADMFSNISEDKLYAQLISLAIDAGDDLSDKTWLPSKNAMQATQQRKSSERPKKYKKGPDVGSNMLQTQDSDLENCPIQSSPHLHNSSVAIEPDLLENVIGLLQNMKDLWEDKLEEQDCDGVEVCSWEELQKQIKNNLEKGAKTSPLSHINQLMLIWNFATLQLKGFGQIKASLKIAQQ